MDRNRQTLAIRMAFVLVLAAATGCGKPMLYHFKHYHRPFAAVARSNKTYFHSSQTGKIIEKDPCQQYCEPGCYGYEETCWTQWPSECAGNCPPPVGVMEQGMPYDGQVIMEGSVVPDAMAMPSEPTYQAPVEVVPSPGETRVQPTVPVMDETRLPAIRVPSIPADVESAIPSPSDSTRLETARPVRMPAVVDDAAIRIANAKPVPKRVLLSPPTELASKREPTLTKSTVAKDESLLGLADKIEANISAPDEEVFKPVPVARSLQLKKPRAKLLTNSATKPKAPKLSKPGATSRKPKTLADKLRVRVSATSAKDYQSAIEATGNQNEPATLMVASSKPVEKMIKIVEREAKPIETKLVKTKPTAKVALAKKPSAKTQSGVSSVKFSDLAAKLKNVKPVVQPAKAKAKVKPAVMKKPARKSSQTVMVPPPLTKKPALKVSDSGSSVIRFAKDLSSKQRLTASPGSTVLKFSEHK